jgi:hypothetical protein
LVYSGVIDIEVKNGPNPSWTEGSHPDTACAEPCEHGIDCPSGIVHIDHHNVGLRCGHTEAQECIEPRSQNARTGMIYRQPITVMFESIEARSR